MTVLLDADLIQLGRHGSDAELDAVLQHRGLREYTVAALWDGAVLTGGSTVLRGMERKKAVISAVLRAGSLAFVRGEDLQQMMLFLGQWGEEALIGLAGQRVAGKLPLVQALLDGAKRREKENMPAGFAQHRHVCHAVAAGLPDVATQMDPPLDDILTYICEQGSADAVRAMVRRFHGDGDARAVIETVLQSAGRLSRDDDARAAELDALYGDVAPAPASPAPFPGSLLARPSRGLKLR
jgi:hypothetical protein